MAGIPTGIPGIDMGGGSISAGGGGPADAGSRNSVGYDSAFSVNFGGTKSGLVAMAPWIAAGVVGVVAVVLWMRRK